MDRDAPPDDPIDLTATPLHLGLGATAEVLPPFDGTMDWYGRYGEATAGDGAEGRLVSWHTFDGPWDSWEMHPHGHEVVVCVAGAPTLHQELPDGGRRTVSLSPGQAAVNAPGVWHTMDVDGSATALFITAGLGTEHRPR
ncbi:MAG: cupin [Microthrixaceae bacterium]